MEKASLLSGLERKDFQLVIADKPVDLYVLRNDSGAEVSITNYGAKVVSIHVPDKDDRWVDGSFIGKAGHTYPQRSAFCLETQHYPDSIHHPDFPSIVLTPSEVFESKTVYQFKIDSKFI